MYSKYHLTCHQEFSVEISISDKLFLFWLSYCFLFCRRYSWEEEIIKKYLDNLQSKGVIKPLDHGGFTRITHDDMDVQVYSNNWCYQKKSSLYYSFILKIPSLLRSALLSLFFSFLTVWLIFFYNRKHVSCSEKSCILVSE